MPKLIPTRSADLGKPKVVIIRDGPGRLHTEGLQKAKLQVVLFDKYNHHCFQAFMHQVDMSAPERSSIEFLFRRNSRKNKDFDFRPGNVSQIKPNENFYNKSNRLLIARPKDAVN